MSYRSEIPLSRAVRAYPTSSLRETPRKRSETASSEAAGGGDLVLYCYASHADSFTSSSNYDASTETWHGYALEIIDDEAAEEYTLSYSSGPDKKTYTVGDTFDTAGLVVQVLDKNSTVVATLSDADLVTTPYTFTDSDISADGQTSAVVISVVYLNKVYMVAVPGLTVNPPREPLTITAQPEDRTVTPGTKASFTVTVTGGTEPYSYQWQYLKPGAAAWVNVAASSGKTSTNTLAPELRHNGYRYRCQITDADGNTVLSGEALLTVHEHENPLTITLQPEDRTVRPGEKVTFTIAVTGGVEPYDIHWKYQKPGTTKWVKTTAPSGRTTEYIMKAEGRHSGYKYLCRVRDAEGTTVLSEIVTLTVGNEFTVTYQPEDRTVLSGQSAPFVTAASGGVQPYAYQWQYQKPGTGAWTNVTPASGGDTSCFTVPKAAARHNGWIIRCRIRDAVGSEIYTNLVTLTVDSTSAPVLTQAPVGASATPGETVTFSVRAEGPGKLSYQWQYLTPGASDYSLKVEMRHNGYRYRVAVSSDNGTSTVSGAVYLDVWEEILGTGDLLNGFGPVRPAAEEDPDFGWDLPVLDLSEKEEALWDLGLISEADVLRYADEAE